MNPSIWIGWHWIWMEIFCSKFEWPGAEFAWEDLAPNPFKSNNYLHRYLLNGLILNLNDKDLAPSLLGSN